ncbi:MAG: ATP-binding cassette domain-containing protein [Chitinophagales bacterium]|nr:ATP-binding cassette domain-containing protein [Chitinophagales bacterium]
MIETSELTFTFDNKRIFTYPEIKCDKGQKLLIYGNSGRGKSTLLHLLAGILTPNHGHIIIDNVDITKLRFGNTDKYRGQKIGFIPQRLHLIHSLNVQDNILAACYFAKKKANKDRLYNITEELKITQLLDRKPQSLSLGEQQRVCIARAIINSPAVLLADEPTSSLDEKNTEKVMELLDRACHIDNTALIVVSHDERIKNSIHHQISLL